MKLIDIINPDKIMNSIINQKFQNGIALHNCIIQIIEFARAIKMTDITVNKFCGNTFNKYAVIKLVIKPVKFKSKLKIPLMPSINKITLSQVLFLLNQSSMSKTTFSKRIEMIKFIHNINIIIVKK